MPYPISFPKVLTNARVSAPLCVEVSELALHSAKMAAGADKIREDNANYRAADTANSPAVTGTFFEAVVAEWFQPNRAVRPAALAQSGTRTAYPAQPVRRRPTVLRP